MKNVPVSFSYKLNDSSRTLPLSWPPTHKSREASGVWVIRNRAWKIFTTMREYERLYNAHRRATQERLPTPEYEFFIGRVTFDKKGSKSKEGFALVTTYIGYPAHFFATKNMGSLEKQIRRITSEDVLSGIQKGFSAACAIKLRDPQGFIIPGNNRNPIMFIDLHIDASGGGLALQQLINFVGDHLESLKRKRRR